MRAVFDAARSVSHLFHDTPVANDYLYLHINLLNLIAPPSPEFRPILPSSFHNSCSAFSNLEGRNVMLSTRNTMGQLARES